MSVVTALSLVLLVGFLATGLVGFLGWRQRMREGISLTADRVLTPRPARQAFAGETRSNAASEGAGL